jgi:thiamine pyrophosphokinase
MIPHVICGDLDSVKQQVRSYYESQGTLIIQNSDQDTNDLEKCIHFITSTKQEHNHTIVIFGSGGRVDQEMCNLNVMYKCSRDMPHLRVVNVSPFSTCFVLLPEQEHIIKRNIKWERKSCAIVPLGEPCERIQTLGLKWNLNLVPHNVTKFRFGDLISSSNEFTEDDQVTVNVSHPVLWITNLIQDQTY